MFLSSIVPDTDCSLLPVEEDGSSGEFLDTVASIFPVAATPVANAWKLGAILPNVNAPVSVARRMVIRAPNQYRQRQDNETLAKMSVRRSRI